MGLGHVNRRELDEIILISKKNPSQAISMFEEYLKKYPKSYSTYTLYAGTLIVLKRFDEAEKVLNNLDTIFEKDKNLIKGTKDYVLLQRDITFVKLKLLAYQKKFEELYDYYNEHCNELGSEYNLDFIKLFCLKKMGKAINVSKFKRKSYLNGQIAEYSEKDFLGHIKGHFSEYNDLEHDHYASVFSGEFPVYKVIDEIKKYIPSNKGLCLGFFEDTYIFKFDNCGVEGGKRTDYFKVVCF